MTPEQATIAQRKALGRRIREQRLRRGLSAARLGALCGVSQQQISTIERGDSDTTLGTLCAIARAIGIHYGLLLHDEAYASLRELQGRDWHTLAIELAQACLECPEERIPLAMRIMADEWYGARAGHHMMQKNSIAEERAANAALGTRL